MGNSIRVENLCCGIVKNASFSVKDGSCFAIRGPSGSGKTTLLNAIAGNRKYTGSIFHNELNIDKRAAWERGFRYLNQGLYLFPYLTIDGNLALAQYAAGKKRDKTERRSMLSEFEIVHLAARRPGNVSGGEAQRAALARALIGGPALLLLDEPFASLDAELKTRLYDKVKAIQEKHQVTIILVSHDEREIECLADERISLYNGVIA
ncbi:putative ABC transporter ATP-binding protein [Spirochaetia bacterium]|nr:putative ABC transporter ATP-binding protein [Spirochaetia bacterium]